MLEQIVSEYPPVEVETTNNAVLPATKGDGYHDASARVSTQSELNSEEAKESFRIYQEAVSLGLVPTQQEMYERVVTATKLRRSILGFYIIAVILMYFILWLFVFALVLPDANELLRTYAQLAVTQTRRKTCTPESSAKSPLVIVNLEVVVYNNSSDSNQTLL